jgi:hypothetical protein
LQGLEARLEEDLAKFKSDNGLDGVKLGMGAARSLDAPEEEAKKNAARSQSVYMTDLFFARGSEP